MSVAKEVNFTDLAIVCVPSMKKAVLLLPAELVLDSIQELLL